MSRWFDGLLQDLRYGLRVARRKPGLTLAVTATLALGIGANTAVFSVIDGVLLRPLPYGEPDRLVAVWESSAERQALRNEVSVPNFLDWKEAAGSFETLGAYYWASATLTGEAGAERVQGILVTPDLLATLRVQPTVGRTFLLGEDEAGQPDRQSVVLSYGLWQRRFGGRDDAIGKSLLVNGEPRTVVGVMPAGFELPVDSGAELWGPLDLVHEGERRSSRYLYVVGRLAPRASLAAAQAELGVVAERLAAEYPESNAGWGVAVVPLHEEIVGSASRAFWVLAATSLFVLLIAATNVSGLLLTGFQARSDELSVRAALGAGTGRLVRQLAVSSAVLGLAAVVPGALLARGCLAFLLHLGPEFVPRLGQISFDRRALAFCLIVALGAALASGLVPAWRVVRASRRRSLTSGLRGAVAAPAKLRGLLVVGQTCLVLALLVGCGLTLRSLVALRHVDPGFDPRGVLAAELVLPRSVYPEDERVQAVQQTLLDRLAALPGVDSVGAASHLPLAGGNMSTDFEFVGRRADPSVEKEVNFRVASPGYFDTLKIPVRQGRAFEASDRRDAPPVVVISESLARRYFQGESPLGQRIRIGDDIRFGDRGPVEAEIVGVVGDVHHWALELAPEPELYVSYFQYRYGHARIVLRSELDPTALAGAVRGEMERLDPDQPIYDVRPAETFYAGALSRADLLAGLLGLFAAVSMILAAIGIAGVVAATTEQRRREIGVRLALGAERHEILALVMRRTGILMAAGVIVGLLLAAGVARSLDSLLYEIEPLDPATFGLAVGLLLVVGLGSGWWPARRAARIDPARVLRDG
jgi:putative ABC transport system permease protein